MKTIIKGGRVINPAANMDEVRDIVIENGIIIKNEKNITDLSDIDKTIDAAGCYVMPDRKSVV